MFAALTRPLTDVPAERFRRQVVRTLESGPRDETAWQLLAERAEAEPSESSDSWLWWVIPELAVLALAYGWSDEHTRAVVTERAVHGTSARPRWSAIRALAETWPDARTRDRLDALTREADVGVRESAMSALAHGWPDERTRHLLVELIAGDPWPELRGRAIEQLAAGWPDDRTRRLLHRLVDPGEPHPGDPGDPGGRGDARDAGEAIDGGKFADPERDGEREGDWRTAAVTELAERWPDEDTRLLLVHALDSERYVLRAHAIRELGRWPLDERVRARLLDEGVGDPEDLVRAAALETLAAADPDDGVRDLLVDHLRHDPDEIVRQCTAEALLQRWPDGTTRAVLTAQATEDAEEVVRAQAITCLAGAWPDPATRALLETRLASDDSADVRRNVLDAFVDHWPDPRTRALFTHRAVTDPDDEISWYAVTTLADRWPDRETRALLAGLVVDDPRPLVRHAAVHALAGGWPDDDTRILLRGLTGSPDPDSTEEVDGFVAVAATEALDRLDLDAEPDGRDGGATPRTETL